METWGAGWVVRREAGIALIYEALERVEVGEKKGVTLMYNPTCKMAFHVCSTCLGNDFKKTQMTSYSLLFCSILKLITYPSQPAHIEVTLSNNCIRFLSLDRLVC